MGNDKGITQYYGTDLAELLSNKILLVYQGFNKEEYITAISEKCNNLGYTQRIELHADQLHKYFPNDFIRAS